MIKKTTLLGLTLLFFASNSILCRLALASHSIDAIGFTVIRLSVGALTLVGISFALNRGRYKFTGKSTSAFSLLIYALFFSFAYLKLNAATGALILFGSVQVTMIVWSLRRGLGPTRWEWTGCGLAMLGLFYLLFPGLHAPDPLGAVLMAIAGIGWGAYSLIGKGSQNPISDTAGNFLLATLFVIPLAGFMSPKIHLTLRGVEWACLSGSISSGLGYSIWYSVLPLIKSTQAAMVQLLVPVMAAFLAVLFLNETLSLRLVLSGLVIGAGIVLTLPIRAQAKAVINKRI